MAFTPTCSGQQLPSYDEMYDQFKNKGIDDVYCISVNDAFVMNAWTGRFTKKKLKDDMMVVVLLLDQWVCLLINQNKGLV